MSAIVRYGPSALRAYRRYAPGLRRAFIRGRSTFRTGRRVYRGASKAFRTAKRFSRQKRKILARAKRIGEFRNSSATKRVKTVDINTASKNTRTLYQYDLTTIAKNTTGNAIDLRNRNLITIKGFKLCMEIENLKSEPLYFNWAVISPKQDTTVGNSDFFRGDGTSRGINFNDSSLNSQDYHCLPINADKYVILTHHRMKLGHAPSQVVDVGMDKISYKNIDKWIPLRRQIRYDDSVSTSNRDKVFLVYWCDQFLKGSGITLNNVLRMQKRVLTYFVEPGSTL